jgi:hypothetical protein
MTTKEKANGWVWTNVLDDCSSVWRLRGGALPAFETFESAFMARKPLYRRLYELIRFTQVT